MKAKEQEKWVPNPKYRFDTPRGIIVTELAGLDKGDTVYFTYGNHFEPARVTSVKKLDRDFVAVNVKRENYTKVLRFTGPLYWDVAIGENGRTMQTASYEGRKLEKILDAANSKTYKYVSALEVAENLLKIKDWLLGSLEHPDIEQ